MHCETKVVWYQFVLYYWHACEISCLVFWFSVLVCIWSLIFSSHNISQEDAMYCEFSVSMQVHVNISNVLHRFHHWYKKCYTELHSMWWKWVGDSGHNYIMTMTIGRLFFFNKAQLSALMERMTHETVWDFIADWNKYNQMMKCHLK